MISLIKKSAIFLIVFIFILFQSSPFFSSHFVINGVKPNLIYIGLVFVTLYFDELFALSVIVVSGYLCDIISISPVGFYMISFLVSLSPLFFLKTIFSFRLLPVFLLAVLCCSLLKGVLIFSGGFFLTGRESAFTYLKQMLFLETFFNTILSAPLYALFKIFKSDVVRDE